jgi:HAD superfamily hydrolase (TIGR01484 family)
VHIKKYKNSRDCKYTKMRSNFFTLTNIYTLDLELFKVSDPTISVKVSRHAVHVSPKGCNKAKGVEEVLKMYGITWDEVAAIGDAMNDKDMIVNAKIGAAVADAQESLKNIARIVTPFPSGRGFAWFAEFILSLTVARGKG